MIGFQLYLFRKAACHIRQSESNFASHNVVVASIQFCIGLLNNITEDLFLVLASAEHPLVFTFFLFQWEIVVYYDIDFLVEFVEFYHIAARRAVLRLADYCSQSLFTHHSNCTDEITVSNHALSHTHGGVRLIVKHIAVFRWSAPTPHHASAL